MRKNEVSKGFAKVMMDAMSEGFYPDMVELTGSYSDVEGRQAVLMKDDERIVMWMERCGRSWDSTDPERIVLRAARFAIEGEDDMDWKYRWSKSWKEHVFFEDVVWRVARDWYVKDENEAVAALLKRRERVGSHMYVNGGDGAKFIGNGRHELTDELLAIVRRVKGFKTVKRENIEVFKSGTAWRIKNVASGNEAFLSA